MFLNQFFTFGHLSKTVLCLTTLKCIRPIMFLFEPYPLNCTEWNNYTVRVGPTLRYPSVCSIKTPFSGVNRTLPPRLQRMQLNCQGESEPYPVPFSLQTFRFQWRHWFYCYVRFGNTCSRKLLQPWSLNTTKVYLNEKSRNTQNYNYNHVGQLSLISIRNEHLNLFNKWLTNTEPNLIRSKKSSGT